MATRMKFNAKLRDFLGSYLQCVKWPARSTSPTQDQLLLYTVIAKVNSLESIYLIFYVSK